MSDVRVQLHCGKHFVIDASDAEKVLAYKWHYRPHGQAGAHGYAARMVRKPTGERTFVYLHRWLLNAGPGQFVDHINGDTLDNRRQNLRICSAKENNRNRHRSKIGSPSRFRGVVFHKQRRRWQAQICIKPKTYYLGTYLSEIEAALAYDAAARKYFGPYASPNFPQLSNHEGDHARSAADREEELGSNQFKHQ